MIHATTSVFKKQRLPGFFVCNGSCELPVCPPAVPRKCSKWFPDYHSSIITCSAPSSADNVTPVLLTIGHKHKQVQKMWKQSMRKNTAICILGPFFSILYCWVSLKRFLSHFASKKTCMTESTVKISSWDFTPTTSFSHSGFSLVPELEALTSEPMIQEDTPAMRSHLWLINQHLNTWVSLTGQSRVAAHLTMRFSPCFSSCSSSSLLTSDSLETIHSHIIWVENRRVRLSSTVLHKPSHKTMKLSLNLFDFTSQPFCHSLIHSLNVRSAHFTSSLRHWDNI